MDVTVEVLQVLWLPMAARPQLFRGTRMVLASDVEGTGWGRRITAVEAENLLRKYTSQGQQGWPHNREAKWRLQAAVHGNMS